MNRCPQFSPPYWARPLLVCTLAATSLTGPALVQAQVTTTTTQQTVQQQLFDAITKGDLQAARDAIEKDATIVKSSSRYGYAPLSSAVERRNKDMVALLLEKGADPNVALSGAVESRNREIVEMLLAKGAKPQTALGTAVDSRNKEMVELLLAKGVDVNQENADRYGNSGSSLLDRALSNNPNREIAALLIEKGADLEKRDREGKTILMRRASYGSNREIMEWLISKGAKVNARDDRGQSALDYAVSAGSADSAAMLVEKGADIKTRDDSGRTPLHRAVAGGNAALVKVLLDKGVDVNAVTTAGDTALHLAAAAPGPILNTLLAFGANPNVRNKRGDLPLHIALRSAGDPFNMVVAPAQSGRYDGYSAPMLERQPSKVEGVLLTLIEKSDVMARDGLGFTPLLLALSLRDAEARDMMLERKPALDGLARLLEVVARNDVAATEKLLLAKPFLVYFRLPNGQTPLHIAALWSARGTGEVLLKKGAEKDARDAAGNTPLMMTAARAGGLQAKRAREMALLLLEKGADINARDRNDATTLQRVLAVRNEELAAALLSKGADANASDRNGTTALHLIANMGTATDGVMEASLTKMLLAAKANPNARNSAGKTPLSLAVAARRVELAKLLLDGGAQADPRDSSGNTPLSLLVASGYSSYSESSPSKAVKDLVALLLDKGADPNARTEGSETLVTRTVSSGNKEILALLLAKKPNLEQLNSYGLTPLMILFSNSRENTKELLDMLLAAGADVNAKSTGGDSVLKMARRNNNKDIIAALEARGAKE